MFDFDAEMNTPTWQEAEWDEITNNHAEREHDASRDAAIKNQGKREAFQDFYHKRYNHRKERTAIASARYALLAIGLTAVAWLVRDLTGLAITLGVIGLCLGLTAAYGVGKYREM